MFFCFLCWSMYWHSKNTVFKKSKKVSFHKSGQFGEFLKTVIRATRRSRKMVKLLVCNMRHFEPFLNHCVLILFYFILSFESSKGKLHRTLLFSYAQVELFSCCVASKLCLNFPFDILQLLIILYVFKNYVRNQRWNDMAL